MDSLNNNSGADAGAESNEDLRKDESMDVKPDASSYVEYELVCNMTSFLEGNGGEHVDKRTLRSMAEALTKRFNDSSPGTLQDVTMENPYGIGYRSPCVSLQPYQGSTSPAGQGRSVREFEEQMANLRKENFNLKLRLYFIEESIPGYKQANNSSCEDTLMKQIIDSKVEMEILRKDLQDKQNLLKEAAQAMNQMEKIQKETELKYQQIVDELNQKLQYFEMERDLEKSRPSGIVNQALVNELMDSSELHENLNALQKIHELEALLKESEEKLTDYQQQLQGLSELVNKRDEAIKEYEEKVKELVFQNAEYIETIENKDKEIANNDAHKLREELQKLKAEMADKTCIAQDLEEKLKSRDQLYGKARLTIQKLMVTIKNQQIENNRLKNSTEMSNVSNTTTDKELTSGVGTANTTLECTGFCRSFSDTEALNDLTCLQKQKYDSIIEYQETTIKNLKAEVKKKTADLQTLVNKELWEKNREIERLNKILNNSSMVSPSKSPLAAHNSSQNSTTPGELQQSFSDVDYNKALQRNKLLQRKVDILIQRLSTERQNDSLIAQLKTELKQARLDAETADKWRRQCADLCATLSTRLEELAGFLNSLLKHKDVLGVLAIDKRKAMRRAVDRSLDLSKSLNMTLSVSGLSMLDQSLAELTNLSDILGEVEIDLADNKTFNSHEELHGQGQSSQSIEVLKAENKALKKELDKRRCLDAKKERRSLPLPTIITENRESESEAWSEPDRKVSLARIGLEDPTASLIAKEQSLTLKKNNETDSDYSDSNSRSFRARSQERIVHLEQQIQQRDNRIMEIQYQLVEAEKRLKQENLKLAEVTRELQQVKQVNEELHQDLVAIGSQDASTNQNETLLLKQLEEKTQTLEKLREDLERLLVESKLAEMQFNAMKTDMEANKQAYEAALQKAAEKEKRQLAKLKQEMDQALEQALYDKEQKHLECLQRDYVSKHEYVECCQQLNNLQKQYIEAQRSIECLQENEDELKQTLVETEMTARNLQKQIDESTLTASKATMERVKALNEKVNLLNKVETLTLELDKCHQDRFDVQRQVRQLEKEKQTFIERIALLQTKQQQQQPTAAKSDDNQSGYTSEEVAMPLSATAAAGTQTTQNIVAQQRLGEQRIQNSSPDLGIESDAGRVSSVELNNIQHTLLKTVEMSPSSKPRADETNVKEEALNDSCGENIKPSNELENASNTSAVQVLSKKHDCLKVEQENAELRRKLLRTKRAFEDTYEKLRNANQRKAQIEKDIKNQILKTHNVLKNVRSNMENEL